MTEEVFPVLCLWTRYKEEHTDNIDVKLASACTWSRLILLHLYEAEYIKWTEEQLKWREFHTWYRLLRPLDIDIDQEDGIQFPWCDESDPSGIARIQAVRDRDDFLGQGLKKLEDRGYIICRDKISITPSPELLGRREYEAVIRREEEEAQMDREDAYYDYLPHEYDIEEAYFDR